MPDLVMRCLVEYDAALQNVLLPMLVNDNMVICQYVLGSLYLRRGSGSSLGANIQRPVMQYPVRMLAIMFSTFSHISACPLNKWPTSLVP